MRIGSAADNLNYVAPCLGTQQTEQRTREAAPHLQRRCEKGKNIVRDERGHCSESMLGGAVVYLHVSSNYDLREFYLTVACSC